MQWGLNSRSGYSAAYWWSTAVIAVGGAIAIALASQDAWGCATFAIAFALASAAAGYRAWQFNNKI
jgi:hypothetical protein